MAKTSKNVLKIDMTGVERGGGRVRWPEGDYPVKIVKATKGESSNGNPQVIVVFKVTEGKMKGKELKDYIVLTEKSRWRFGNLLDALSIKWSQKALAIDLNKLVGKELGITVYDDEYNNKVSSKVSDYLDAETMSGLADDDEEEEDDEDSDDEDDDDDEDLDEVDLDDDL